MYTITGAVNKVLVTFIVDIEAAVTLLSKKLWHKMKGEGAELTPLAGHSIRRSGQNTHLDGTSLLKVWLGKNEFEVYCLIVDIHTAEDILGCDFLGPNQCIVETGNKTLRLGSGETIPLNHFKTSTPHSSCGSGDVRNGESPYL